MVRLDELNVALFVRYGSFTFYVRPTVDPRRPQEQTYSPGTSGTKKNVIFIEIKINEKNASTYNIKGKGGVSITALAPFREY